MQKSDEFAFITLSDFFFLGECRTQCLVDVGCELASWKKLANGFYECHSTGILQPVYVVHYGWASYCKQPCKLRQKIHGDFWISILAMVFNLTKLTKPCLT